MKPSQVLLSRSRLWNLRVQVEFFSDPPDGNEGFSLTTVVMRTLPV